MYKHHYQDRQPLDLIEIDILHKAQKGQRQSAKRQNDAKPEGKCYNCSIKRHYVCNYKKSKKDDYYIAITTSKAKKSLKEKKAETRTSKTREIYLLVKSVKRDSDSDDSLEVSEETQSVPDILPLEKETSPEEIQEKIEQMAKAAIIVI